MRLIPATVLMVLVCLACSEQPDEATEPVSRPFVVMTFNTGSGPEAPHDDPPDDGYTSAEAALTDAHYGNGLAWKPFAEEARLFFEAQSPDVVVFQEIFWSGDCPAVPEEARAGFVCEDWQEGDPSVVQVILGPDYQVVCHPGKPDKCAAVHARFGRFRGCDEAFCLEGMVGFRVPDCGSGARVARVVIDRVDGRALTLVNVHGSSGLSQSDVACRVAQVEQVFLDLGDGEPGANGAHNLVMGDFNTDPGRFGGEASADRWGAFVGEGTPFHYISEVGADVPPTYAGFFNIDHVLSDVFEGACVAPGVTEGLAPVTDAVFFDHTPQICTLSD